MKRFSLILAGLAALAGASFGTTVSNCSNCDGGVYSMNYETVSIGGVNDVFNLFVTMDSTNYAYPSAYIHAVSPKVSNTYVSINLLQAPGGVSNWLAPVPGGLGSSGCDGSGVGYFCETTNGLGAPVSTLLNTFEWRITIPHDALITGDTAASLKLQFVDSTGTKVGALFSQELTLDPRTSVPEPATNALIGLGLAGVAMVGRRVRK